MNPELSMTPDTPSPESTEWDRLYRYIQDQYGIEVATKRRDRLIQKLQRRLRQVPAESPDEYLQYIRDNPDEVPRLLDEISTNKTSFFREDGHWSFLRENLLPKWSDSKPRIDVWSAAVSTGEELYSLFFMLEEQRRKGGSNYRGLGTDLSTEALEHARKGTYSTGTLQSVPRRYRSRFLEKTQDSDTNCRRVRSDIRRRATFRQFNLSEATYPIEHRFDLIFCCNVLIYFDDDVVRHVINQLQKRLVQDGYLFVGHTESLHNIDHPLVREQPAIYKKTDDTT
ncbi:MAG: protein-glutamate O-methyltransferase CheR [bacterium]